MSSKKIESELAKLREREMKQREMREASDAAGCRRCKVCHFQLRDPRYRVGGDRAGSHIHQCPDVPGQLGVPWRCMSFAECPTRWMAGHADEMTRKKIAALESQLADSKASEPKEENKLARGAAAKAKAAHKVEPAKGFIDFLKKEVPTEGPSGSPSVLKAMLSVARQFKPDLPYPTTGSSSTGGGGGPGGPSIPLPIAAANTRDEECRTRLTLSTKGKSRGSYDIAECSEKLANSVRSFDPTGASNAAMFTTRDANSSRKPSALYGGEEGEGEKVRRKKRMISLVSDEEEEPGWSAGDTFLPKSPTGAKCSSSSSAEGAALSGGEDEHDEEYQLALLLSQEEARKDQIRRYHRKHPTEQRSIKRPTATTTTATDRAIATLIQSVATLQSTVNTLQAKLGPSSVSHGMEASASSSSSSTMASSSSSSSTSSSSSSSSSGVTSSKPPHHLQRLANYLAWEGVPCSWKEGGMAAGKPTTPTATPLSPAASSPPPLEPSTAAADIVPPSSNGSTEAI